MFLDSLGRRYREQSAYGGPGTGPLLQNIQSHFNRKIRDLTKGELSAPIVVFSVISSGSLARSGLRLVALGYTQVYWYRGGVEAWQVNDLPESDLVCATGSSAGARIGKRRDGNSVPKTECNENGSCTARDLNRLTNVSPDRPAKQAFQAARSQSPLEIDAVFAG